MRKFWAVLAGAGLVGSAPGARAAGYDPAVSHSARHVAVGGTAVASVADPSALSHNPAGLAHVQSAAAMAGATFFIGSIRGTPEGDINVESETLVAPLPLLGGAVRPLDGLTLGLLVHPIAAAGAVYEYSGAAGLTRDETRAAFVEVALGAAIEILPGLRLGAAQRTTIARLHRFKRGSEASRPGIDMTLSGFGFTGWRAGVQWQAVRDAPDANATTRRNLELGVAYRHTTRVSVDADEGTLLAQPARDATSELVLPAKLVAGTRADLGRFGLAFDAEYAFTSQNERGELDAEIGGGRIQVPAIYDWRDAVTLRWGAELRLLSRGELALRAGFVRDGAATSRAYPTPFGPPPTATHVVTAGVGVEVGRWSPSIAYGYRFGETTVNEAELGAEQCPLCGGAGEYALGFHTVAADVVYRFE